MIYRDLLKRRRRTWEFGTTKKVTVLYAEPQVLVVQDDNGEGYVLLGGDGDEPVAEVGDEGVITFTAGGPLGGYWGGYWRFEKSEPKPEEQK